MKLIIDIPKERYEWIKNHIEVTDYQTTEMLYESVRNGTEQKQKTGRWIIVDDCERFIVKCSECGRIEDSRMISKYPYCHCGARMEEENADSD